MRLFWRERQAEKEREAREAMTKMDEVVNGKPEPPKSVWAVSLLCATCGDENMTVDPSKQGRFICPQCQGVAMVTVESWPKRKTKSNP